MALWLDGGRVQEFGPTEAVLGAYEMHLRLLNATPEAAAAAAPASDSAAGATQPASGEPAPASASPYPPPQSDASSFRQRYVHSSLWFFLYLLFES